MVDSIHVTVDTLRYKSQLLNILLSDDAFCFCLLQGESVYDSIIPMSIAYRPMSPRKVADAVVPTTPTLATAPTVSSVAAATGTPTGATAGSILECPGKYDMLDPPGK